MMKHSCKHICIALLMFLLQSGPPALGDSLVFDNDLTKGKSAFTGMDKGGNWDFGWLITDKEQRLTWDAGYPINNGYFEFWLTTSLPPVSPLITRPDGSRDRPDVHWAGISGVPQITMEKHAFALRLGQLREGEGVGHGFSKLVVLGANNSGETEKAEIVAGNYATWKPLSNGKTVIYFKLEWKNGIATLYMPDGTKKSCPTKGKLGNEVKISKLRYPWVGGGDDSIKHSFAGMRFLRARLIDLDKPGTVPPVQMPKEITPPTGTPTPTPTPELSATITLGNRWNMVSLPIQPTDNRSEQVLSSINGKFQAVYAFNSETQTYQSFIPGATSNSLSTLDAGRGYWFYMNEPVSLKITGTKASSSVNLSANWNLVGFNRTSSMNIVQATSSISSKLSVIYHFDNATQSYQGYFPSQASALESLDPGKGYWFFVSDNVQWQLPT
jgi:hypothetical protein